MHTTISYWIFRALLVILGVNQNAFLMNNAQRSANSTVTFVVASKFILIHIPRYSCIPKEFFLKISCVCCKITYLMTILNFQTQYFLIKIVANAALNFK